MAIRITHKRLSNGTGHEHITDLRWIQDGTGDVGESTRAAMVKFVDDNAAGAAYTQGGASRALVGSVHPTGRAPYVRTYSDGDWNNNLLALPDF